MKKVKNYKETLDKISSKILHESAAVILWGTGSSRQLCCVVLATDEAGAPTDFVVKYHRRIPETVYLRLAARLTETFGAPTTPGEFEIRNFRRDNIPWVQQAIYRLLRTEPLNQLPSDALIFNVWDFLEAANEVAERPQEPQDLEEMTRDRRTPTEDEEYEFLLSFLRQPNPNLPPDAHQVAQEFANLATWLDAHGSYHPAMKQVFQKLTEAKDTAVRVVLTDG